jgi:hypothetical protein
MMELHQHLGVAPLNQLPAPWVEKIDEQWTIAINGQETKQRIEPTGAMAADVPPYYAAVWYNGWLAGLLTPFDGILAAGEAANEDTLIEAMRRRLADA